MLKNLRPTVQRIIPPLSAAQLKWGALAAAAALATFVSVFAQPVGLERSVLGLRNEINTRPASGTIVLVEIDAKSIRSIDKWPWPRTVHAQLVDRLNAAGASQIAFDVDFSSRSVDADDLAFAEAIKRAGGKVILPTFRQPASNGETDVFVESQPIDVLRNEAFLGGVNIRPDADGRVNTYPYGTLTGGMPRPSIGALLADASGPIDFVFPIDHSIDINSIPRLSYADILAGDFELSAVEGKRVIVGATAIELGDHYVTDRYGVVPGVTLQILAAETILAGLVLPSMGPWPLLLFVTLCVLVGSRFRRGQLLISRFTALAAALLIFGLSVLAHRFAFAELDTVPALVFLAGCLVGQFGIEVLKEIERDRLHDHATRLPNLAAWKRDNIHENVTNVIVARCTNFGEILSTLGETESVDLVLQIAERLKLTCGIADLYRIEHEQFCWKLEGASFDDVDSLLEGASRLFNAPIRVGERSIRANFCFGVAKGECSDPGKLCSQGALAAKRASAMGVRVMWYTDNFAGDVDHELFIASEFLEALERGEISVVYQPKFNIAEGRVTGAEALVRWNNSSRGPLSTAVFIPVLEKTNLIAPLTLFVLRKALESLALWNKTGEPKTCAVNLSALLLSDTVFVDEAIDLIRCSEIVPADLTLELTETAVLTSLEAASSALGRFASLGTKLSVDDYGTGQSTLSYLKNFAASEIKIDQSFVGQIETMDANRIMVRSTIEMAHALGMSVVAEGVENESVMKILRDYGCDVVQGWYIGAGVPSEQFMEDWGGGASGQLDCTIYQAVRGLNATG